METSTGAVSRSGFSVGARWRSALVGVLGVPVVALSLVVGAAVPASAISSITSPGAAAALGMTQAEYVAFIANGVDAAALYANGAGAVAATVPATSAATATGAAVSTSGGSIMGRILVGIGGLLGFKLLTPDSDDPGTGLPVGGPAAVSEYLSGYSVRWFRWGMTDVITDQVRVGLAVEWGSTLAEYGPTTARVTVSFADLDVPADGVGCGGPGDPRYCGIDGGVSVATFYKCFASDGTPGGNWQGPLGSSGPNWNSAVTVGMSSPGVCAHGVASYRVQIEGSAGVSERIYQPTGSSSPERHVQQTVTCKRSDGTTSTVTNNTDAAPWVAGQLVEVAGLMCPSGSRAVGVQATIKTAGGEDVKVIDMPAGGALEEATNVPEPCYSGSTCTLRVQRLKDTTGTWVDVNPGSLDQGWWSDPVRDLKYRCVYGTGSVFDVVPIAQCSWYANPEAGGAVPPVEDPTTDPTSEDLDCSFGWTDLLTGGVFIDGSKCVIRWAFMPSAGTLQGLWDQIQVRAPFSVVVEAGRGAGALTDAYGDAGACGSIADFTSEDISARIECDAFSKIPGATALRSVVGVVFVALTGIYCFNLGAARFTGGGS